MTDHDDVPAGDQPQPDDVDSTQPIDSIPAVDSTPAVGFGPIPPPPSWVDYGARTQRLEGVDQPRHADRSGVARWVWPTIAIMALVIGMFGGVVGSAAYRLVDDGDDIPGTVADGLNGVDTVSLPPLDADDTSVAAVAQKLLPSTVQISAELDGTPGGATGSGFVLDKQGHIITNNHVVASAAEDDGKIEVVNQDGERFEASLVGRSPVYDLAVLFVPDATGLKPAALGSSKQLRVGDGVVALGSPLGLSSTVTSGIVSALNRPVTTGESADQSSYINAVQTDAAINPGNSGGPLVNLVGQVVGVNSAIATNGGGTFNGEAGNIGVGFAIPVEQVRVTADQILRTGKASYPVIGAEVNTATQASSDGALIRTVNADAPADEAGLKDGDIVIAVDGERVSDGISLIVNIRTHQPGQTVSFTYLRNGDERTVDVELGSKTG